MFDQLSLWSNWYENSERVKQDQDDYGTTLQDMKVKGVGTPREAPKNVFWDVSVFSSDSGREMIVSGSSKHQIV